MQIALNINGFDVQAQYDDRTVEEIFLPLLRKLSAMQRERSERLIVFLAAPPATGKSTLAAFLEHLSAEDSACVRIQSLGMDGFHFHQDYILSHTVIRDGVEVPMKQVKGAPDSFDVEKLRRTLTDSKAGDVRWPFYDRRLHDVVEYAIPADAPVLLVEGNWLLLNRPVWDSLPHDYSIFIGAEEHLLRDRLINRKMRGGATREEAELHYERADGPNVRLCMAESLPANLTLRMTEDGDYRLV